MKIFRGKKTFNVLFLAKVSDIFFVFCGVIVLGLFFSTFVFATEKQKVFDEMKIINEELKEMEEAMYKNKDVFDKISSKIPELTSKKASLENQLKIFKNQINLTEKKITDTEKKINVKRLEISNIYEVLEKAEIEIAEEKQAVSNFIKNIYLEEKRCFSEENNNLKIINLLLAEEGIAKTLKNIENLYLLEQVSEKIFVKLAAAITVFEVKKDSLERKKRSYHALKNILQYEKTNLLSQKKGRETLIAETQGREIEYQKLLEKSKKEYEKTFVLVANLRKNQGVIQKKIKSVKQASQAEVEKQQIEMLKDVFEKTVSMGQYDLDHVISDAILKHPLMWPVSPVQGLSAYFLDSSYEDYFGVRHYAIDIKVSQGTDVRAPASGYVVEVKENGNEYSYVLIMHKDNLSTLYGHLSEIFVKKDDLIQTGQIIGKSGGTPGTKGAGTMTTGPHLHFEVHEKGVNKNPLDYLPIELLP